MAEKKSTPPASGFNSPPDSPTVDQLFEMVNKRKDQMDSLVHRLETRMDNLVQFQNQQLDSYKKELADMVRLHKDEIDTWMTEIERQDVYLETEDEQDSGFEENFVDISSCQICEEGKSRHRCICQITCVNLSSETRSVEPKPHQSFGLERP